MLDYGWGKIAGDQFGHRSQEVLNTPLKDVSKFNLAWHLFSLDRSFDMGVGLVQIIGAGLIVFNRTSLIGALLLLPILGQIFLVDLAFTTEVFGAALPLRLFGMIVSDFLILYYYKEKMILVWHNLTDGTTTKYKYKWWIFLFLPILAWATDFIFAILTWPIKQILNMIFR